MNGFFSINISDIVGFVLSIVSIIIASRIPKAIMKYKFEIDISMNIHSMRVDLDRKRTLVTRKGNITNDNFVANINNIVSMLRTYRHFLDINDQIRIYAAQKNYNKLINKECITRSEAIRLIDEYKEILHTISVKNGEKGFFENDKDKYLSIKKGEKENDT